MKTIKKLLVLLMALCLTAGFGMTAFATDYPESEVSPGQSGILPGDTLTTPDNTVWATLTASWGVRINFVDHDDSRLKSELVPVSDAASGSSSAPASPARKGYTFAGWERVDSTRGTAKLSADGKVTGINGPGPIIFKAKYTSEPIVPKTGDSNTPMLWTGLVLLSIAAFAAISAGKRKQNG